MQKFSRTIGSKMNPEESKTEIKRYNDKKHPNAIQFALFGRDIIDDLLKDEKCHGVKMELAEGTDGVQKIILFGVDENGVVIENSDTNASMTCPPFCNPSTDN